jgi:hypothetical protein
MNGAFDCLRRRKGNSTKEPIFIEEWCQYVADLMPDLKEAVVPGVQDGERAPKSNSKNT